jgi:hypothetical protein
MSLLFGFLAGIDALTILQELPIHNYMHIAELAIFLVLGVIL